MKLELIYNEINWNIIKRFIFYIPNNEYSKMLFANKTLSEIDQKIFYFNGDKNVTEYPNINFSDFFDKEKLLQNNLFKLLELKSQMDKDAFKLFHKTYLDKLEGFINIADLVNKYIQRDIPDCSKNVLIYVNYNFAILIEHGNAIKEILPRTNEVKSKIEKFDLSILEELPLEIKNDFKLEQIKSVNTPFIDFIRHENKNEIERIITAHYSDLRGISLRYLIEFLIEKKILLINYGDKTKIHKSLKILFNNNNIGSVSSIFDLKIDREKDCKYLNAKDNFLNTFKNLI